MTGFLLRADIPRHQFGRVVILVSLMWLAVHIPNIACGVCLSRRNFREFAVKYSEEIEGERKHQAMQECAKRQIRKELKKGIGS